MSEESICRCPYCRESVLVISETADPADTRVEKLAEELEQFYYRFGDFHDEARE